MKEIIDLLPDKKEICFVVKQAFDSEFCEKLIQDNNFKKANTHYPTYYRNNDRFVLDDNILSENLFQLIKEYIPKDIKVDTSNNELEAWSLLKLNSRIRFCRYLPEQYFNKHLDGVYYESENIESKLTFMLYLNSKDDFTGGRTLFFNSKTDNEIIQSFLPNKGDLIIFDHNIWHSGEKLINGKKYVLRSDILYNRIQNNSSNHLLEKKPFSLGHQGYIWKIAKFNNMFISGGRDKKIKVWNDKGYLLQVLDGHENSVVDLLQLNKNTLVSASRDKTIVFWKLNESGHFKIINKITAHQSTILSLSKLNDFTFFSSGGDGIINLIDENGLIIKSWKAHNEWIWEIVKITGNIICSCGEDGILKIWQINDLTLLFQLNHGSPITTMNFDKKNNLLYFADYQGNINISEITEDNTLINKKTIKNAHNGIIRDILLPNSESLSNKITNLPKSPFEGGMGRAVSCYNKFPYFVNIIGNKSYSLRHIIKPIFPENINRNISK